MFLAGPAVAKVLPEDRSDTLWHLYDGGGVTIQGPSVLVRQSYKDKVSVWANYYVDMISGASIDVQATASEYDEERTQVSAGIDYLYDKTIVGFGYTQSSENDYEAETYNVSMSHDFFGDLTSVSLGFAYGSDMVMRSNDMEFVDEAQHRSYRFEVSQIMTPRIIVNLGAETVVDEGFLNNPYRSVRFLNPESETGFSYQSENYPRTRASDAFAIRAMMFLPYRAAVRGEYRVYSDSWGIEADNIEISYTHPIGEVFEIDARVRTYSQTGADFYADLFPFRDAQNFLARDKEMSTFDNLTVGLGFTYNFAQTGFWFFSKGTVNLKFDYVSFDYKDFRDPTQGLPLGEEPLYQLDAYVTRAFVALWF